MRSRQQLEDGGQSVLTAMLRPGFELANAEDMQIPRCVDDAEQAIAVIREHHARWRAGQGKLT